MNVTVNGRAESLPGTVTVAELIARFGRDPSGRGVAVAVNGEVVPRARWNESTVEAGDRIELLEAVQGG